MPDRPYPHTNPSAKREHNPRPFQLLRLQAARPPRTCLQHVGRCHCGDPHGCSDSGHRQRRNRQPVRRPSGAADAGRRVMDPGLAELACRDADPARDGRSPLPWGTGHPLLESPRAIARATDVHRAARASVHRPKRVGVCDYLHPAADIRAAAHPCVLRDRLHVPLVSRLGQPRASAGRPGDGGAAIRGDYG